MLEQIRNRWLMEDVEDSVHVQGIVTVYGVGDDVDVDVYVDGVFDDVFDGDWNFVDDFDSCFEEEIESQLDIAIYEQMSRLKVSRN
jgi:hypothetical protein